AGTRFLGTQRLPWKLQIVADLYQPGAPIDVPASVATPGGDPVIPVVLDPGASYPFPEDPPGHRPVRLRGTVLGAGGSRVEGVRVEALEKVGAPLPEPPPRPRPAFSALDGQWVLVLEELPPQGKLVVRFTLPDNSTRDLGTSVKDGIENNLPFQIP